MDTDTDTGKVPCQDRGRDGPMPLGAKEPHRWPANPGKLGDTWPRCSLVVSENQCC